MQLNSTFKKAPVLTDWVVLAMSGSGEEVIFVCKICGVPL